MDSLIEVYLRRARTEISSAEILFKSSENSEILRIFNIDSRFTFYSGVISHAYYCIFYCAKAMLLSQGAVTKSPNIHQKTLNMFKKVFIDTSLFDKELFKLYEELIIKAEELLEVFKDEKRKRGNFTYNTIPQANKSPAEESLNNCKKFYRHCNTYLINKLNKL